MGESITPFVEHDELPRGGRALKNSGPYRAQPPVDDRTAPDSAGLDEDQPLAVFGLVRG